MATILSKIRYIHNNKPFNMYNFSGDESQHGYIIDSNVNSIVLYQDILTPCIQGNIVFDDINLYSTLPFQYDDKIQLHITHIDDNTNKIKYAGYLEFRIVTNNNLSYEPNITDRENIKRFSIDIIDDKSYESYIKHISKRYYNINAIDIIKDQLTVASNWKLNKLDSNNLNLNITTPLWSAYHNIAYITRFIQGNGGNAFVLFPELPLYINNKTNYSQNLITITSILKGKYQINNNIFSLTSDYNRMYNVWLEKDMNDFELLQSGVDINNTKINSIKQVLAKKIYSEYHLNDSYKKFRIKTNIAQIDNGYVLNYFQKLLLNQISIYTTMSGDIERKIGQIVQVDFPSQFNANNKRDFKDKKHSGKYLIKRIEHNFVKDENSNWIYSQKINLITDGINDN